MPFRRIFTALVIAAAATGVGADDVITESAAPVTAECPREKDEKPIATEYGSAGFMKNLAESEDSIRTIAGRMLKSALTAENTRLPEGCESFCGGAEVPEVVYRVAPVAFLADDKQNDVCVAFEEQTSADPMLFGARSFASVAELNDWIMAFSQGRGDDGKLLYERCSSNCSPRYTFLIGQENSGYEVRAEVLCGLARDKSNDQYLISTALRRRCAVN